MSKLDEAFSEGSSVSMMRVQSALMFIVSVVFLFRNVNLDTLTWEGFLLVTFLFGMAFFPKTIQKKYETLVTR